MLFASAVPEIVGVLSFVTSPSTGELITGALGTEVSTVISVTAEGMLVFPAASLAVAVRLCDPSDNAELGVNVQTPEPSAVTVPIRVTPSYIRTVLFASDAPVISGVLSFVTDSSAGVLIVGAAGAVVSIVTNTASEVAPV